MNEEKKIAKATSWSFLTQVIAKIIPPISNMILARLFAPEVFGAIATISMVTSFADTLSESGFQKYIVSKTYTDHVELERDADVAFWTNLGISVTIWLIISVFRVPLCGILGNPELTTPLVVACIQLPITSLSSIQTAVFQREYDFRRPFISQFISSLVTLLITLGLAFCGLGYWAIIVGNIAGFLLRAVILTYRSAWYPHFYFSFFRLKNIFSFSMWIMAEGMAVWLSSWFDSFIVGNKMSEHNLGIYKNSQSTVNGLLAIPQYGITNVLIVTLSKNTEDREVYNRIFLDTQRILAYLLLPLGFGIFIYRELVVSIVFGSGWEDAEFVIALWSLVSVFRILLVSINSAVFISKGKPKLSLVLQMIDIVILIPTCFWGIRYGLMTFVIIRCIVRLDIIIPSLYMMSSKFGITAKSICGNLVKPLVVTALMVGVGYLTKNIFQGMVWQFCSIGICILFYFAACMIFAKEDLETMIKMIKKNR